MRTAFLIGAAIAAVAGASLAAVVAWPIGAPVGSIPADGDPARGTYLARAGGCIACHTNTSAGGAALAGGAPLQTRFGTFVPPNLTTDPEHGIGAWTVEDFARAVRQGISPTGAPYYPSFPYPFYAGLTDQGIADMWAAFRTVPPVSVPTPGHSVDFPFDQRWGLKLWRAAFVPTPPPRDPTRSDAWNRGRELVDGLAHCGACHTPRNIAGARILGRKFSGNDDLPGGNKAPPIDRVALAREGWDVATLAYALRTGLKPDGDVFGGSMGAVVFVGTAFLTETDRLAMATYLMETEDEF